MPNTVVKLTNAESTWLEAAREDRKLLIKKEALVERLVLFCCVYHLRQWAFEGNRCLAVFPKVDAASPRGLMAPPGLLPLGAKGSVRDRLRLPDGLRACRPREL